MYSGRGNYFDRYIFSTHTYTFWHPWDLPIFFFFLRNSQVKSCLTAEIKTWARGILIRDVNVRWRKDKPHSFGRGLSLCSCRQPARRQEAHKLFLSNGTLKCKHIHSYDQTHWLSSKSERCSCQAKWLIPLLLPRVDTPTSLQDTQLPKSWGKGSQIPTKVLRGSFHLSKLKTLCYVLNCDPQIHILKSSTPVPQNAIELGDKFLKR